VFFEYDSAELIAPAQAALNANAELLKRYPTWVVTLEGHCDERGTAEYNLALGERRAQSAKRFLTALGVDGSRLSTVSYGEERSVCTETTEGCYAKNRRVHFTIQ